MSLNFINAEKHINDTLIFPSFDLLVKSGDIVAICLSVNVREYLLDLLLGEILLSNGKILVGDHDITEGKRWIGFLFLNDGLYERLSIEEVLVFYKRLYASSLSVPETIRMMQLESKQKVRVKSLSYSERKRVQFACLLMQNPDIYILEEADQNLDIESKRIFLSVFQQLRGAGKSILILTSNMESAVIAAEKVYRLDDKGLHPIHVGTETEIETLNEIGFVQPVRFEKIPTKVNDKIVLFDPPEIDYIESDDGQSILRIKGESFVSTFTLKELEDRLLPFGFFRCHRSYIVNLQKVREVITWTRNSFSLVLDDVEKSKIPLSKTKMADLKEMLGLK